MLTAADEAIVKNALTGSNFGEDFFVVSVIASWAERGGTVGEGPITVGVAHGDLTETEIAEWSVAELTDPDDIIQKERSRRPARKVGAFPGLAANEVLNHGDQIRTGVKFSIGDGHAIVAWAANRSGAPLTTGMVIDINGVIYGRWQR